jgi:hypothetical protein
VVDRVTFHDLYQRTCLKCRSGTGATSYDTVAAQDAARGVVDEPRAPDMEAIPKPCDGPRVHRRARRSMPKANGGIKCANPRFSSLSGGAS